jgi:hypothetical protein
VLAALCTLKEGSQARPFKLKPGQVRCGRALLSAALPASIGTLRLSLILQGRKSLEIRGRACKKPVGERIYLARSGGGGVVLGSVEFAGCSGPLSRDEYAVRSGEHCVASVAGAALPYGASTYGWGVRAPRQFARPVAYGHRQGCVVWARMERDGTQ